MLQFVQENVPQLTLGICRLRQEDNLPEIAVFQYKCDNFYTPEADGGISIKDETLGINWQIPVEKAILSEKDVRHGCLKDFNSPFDYNINLYPESE